VRHLRRQLAWRELDILAHGNDHLVFELGGWHLQQHLPGTS
jgi:hypothetical protein